MQERTAKLLSELFLRHGGEQNNILEEIKSEEPPEEFLKIKEMIAESMGSIYFDILSKIFSEYPMLKPEYLRSGSQLRGG